MGSVPEAEFLSQRTACLSSAIPTQPIYEVYKSFGVIPLPSTTSLNQTVGTHLFDLIRRLLDTQVPPETALLSVVFEWR